MDHLVAVGFSQTGAKLPRDRARFLQRQGSRAEAPFERLALEKLHCEKVDLSLFGGSCVDLENFTDIRVADFRRVARFRRQTLSKIRLGRFDGDPALQLLGPHLVLGVNLNRGQAEQPDQRSISYVESN